MVHKKRYTTDQSVIQNAAKTLLANIRFADVDNPIKSIVMTSSVPNEGKSSVSFNLAKAIATSGKRVLLVECDMRRRSLYRMLKMTPPAGIYAVLTDQVQLSQATCPTSYENLYFLDVEPSIPNPADIISSKRFAKLLEVLEEHYDYVLLDTPPVGAFIDAAILSSMVDATIFVVRANHAKRNEITTAFDQLKKAGANIIGTVLNCCEDETRSSTYYYDYYNKDGSSSRPHSSSHQSHQSHQSGSSSSSEAQPSGKRFK